MINQAGTARQLYRGESAAPAVYEVNPLDDSRWETLARSHPRSSVFHCTNWLRALRTAYGYDPVVVTTCSPQEALSNGLVLCRIRSWLTGPRLVSLPFSDHCEPLVNNSAELDSLLSNIKQNVDRGGWKYMELRPTISQPSGLSGFGEGPTYYLHRLELNKSALELFHGFHKSCVQRKIRRAEREGLKYEEGTSAILLNKFYKLLTITRRRLFLPPQPPSWFRALIDSFGKDLQIRVASKDDLPIASILTISHKKTIVYKYGCSDARFNRFGGMALLFWNTIQEAKDKGLSELDMGRSDDSNLGLMQFKERWGAVGTKLKYWSYPHRIGGNSHLWQRAVLRRLVPAMPNSVLRTVGSVFYKHIG